MGAETEHRAPSFHVKHVQGVVEHDRDYNVKVGHGLGVDWSIIIGDR